MTPSQSPDAVLTPGQWEALLFQAPEQVRPLVMLLAMHHGAVERPVPDQCPICGRHPDEAEQPKLFG